MSAGISSVLPSATYAGALTEFWANAGAGGGGGGQPGVTQIVAGNNITISPGDGEGVVTINATASPAGGVTEILAPGPGLAASASTGIVSLTNTGVTSLVAGAGIVLSSATGDVTVSSSAGSVTSAYIGFVGNLGLPAGVFGYTKIGELVTVTGYMSGAGVNTPIAISPGILALLPAPVEYSVFNSTFVISGHGATLDNADVFGRVNDGNFGAFTITFGGSTSQRGSFTWTYRTTA